MIDPYKLVLINIISSFLVLAGTYIYRYIYPKKKINLFFILLVLSFLLCLSLFRKGDYESGDFNIHIYRIMSFYDSLKEGILMPSWAAELNATYGNPLFIFNYSLPYYVISFFHFVGLSFINSMKLYLGLNIIFSGIFMYLWIKELTQDKIAGFTAAVFYLFNPYHLIDIHFRATLGESTLFTFAPLAFYFLTLYFRKKKFIYLILTSLATATLFLAHPLVACTILGILILFALLKSWQTKNGKAFFLSLSFLIIGAFSSIYEWVSFSLYSSSMFQIPNTTTLSDAFKPIWEHLFSPWRYGFLFQGPKGELALILGYAQTLVIIAIGILLLTKKVSQKTKKDSIFWLLLTFLFIFLMQPISLFIWKYFSIFWMLLPTGRLLLPIAICTSVLAGYFALYLTTTPFKKKILVTLIAAAILSTILNWGHRRVIPSIDDNALRLGVWKSTVTEGITAYFLNNKWADPKNFWFSELPEDHLEIISGKGRIKEIERTSIKHTYIVDAQTTLTVKENTLYFPGWTLKSNNLDVALFPGYRGVIHVKLPPGLQYVELSYKDLPAYMYAKLISVSIMSSLLFALFINLIKKGGKKKRK